MVMEFGDRAMIEVGDRAIAGMVGITHCFAHVNRHAAALW
jgi:hypothetical protein